MVMIAIHTVVLIEFFVRRRALKNSLRKEKS